MWTQQQQNQPQTMPMPMNNSGMNEEVLQSVGRMVKMVEGINDPAKINQIMGTLATHSPMVANILNNTNGMSLQQVFVSKCQQMGVNPEMIINQINRMR